MSSTPVDPEKFEHFISWARSNGITYDKIAPTVFPGAGLGMVSTCPIAGAQRQRTKYESNNAGGDAIAFTPTPLLVTRENLDRFSPGVDWKALLKERVNDERGLTTHAAFATAIAREAGNTGNPWKPWMDVFPKMREFAQGLPILWSEEERSLLPPSTKYLLEKQVKKFEWDYQAVKNKGFSFPREHFLWAWLVVNTRCLFYKPETNEYKVIDKGDCMALCPFIDFFNHSDQKHCQVQFFPEGFSVSPPASAYPESSQVFVSYGCHSNDFLIVEYGFILPSEKNRWDDVSVTSLVLPKLSPAHRGILQEEGFLGDYHFDGSAFCFRTQAAARLINIENPRSAGMYRKLELWRRFISGLDDGERDVPAVEEFLLGLLDRLQFAAEEALEKIGALENEHVARVLTARWEQILGMKTTVRREILTRGERGDYLG